MISFNCLEITKYLYTCYHLLCGCTKQNIAYIEIAHLLHIFHGYEYDKKMSEYNLWNSFNIIFKLHYYTYMLLHMINITILLYMQNHGKMYTIIRYTFIYVFRFNGNVAMKNFVKYPGYCISMYYFTINYFNAGIYIMYMKFIIGMDGCTQK